MKLTKRMNFKFFRSYYDVYNELETDADKVAFTEALLDKQFLGVDPKDLKGVVKLAYVSQSHSINTQVKGYNDKMESMGKPILTGSKLSTPYQPPYQPPYQQEKEKEKEKVQKNVQVKERKTQFKKLLSSFSGKYDKEMLEEFFEYWSETKIGGNKMRFEMEKTFGVGHRLSSWFKRQKEWKKSKLGGGGSLADKMKRDYGIKNKSAYDIIQEMKHGKPRKRNAGELLKEEYGITDEPIDIEHTDMTID